MLSCSLAFRFWPLRFERVFVKILASKRFGDEIEEAKKLDADQEP